MHPHDRSEPRRTSTEMRVGRRRHPPARVLLWRARVPLAALLLGLACAVVVGELRPEPAPTATVLVASHALTAGHLLAASDLEPVDLPSGLVPSGTATSPESLVGEPLAVAVPAGLPIVDGLLVHDLVAGPAGTVVAAVRLADPAVAALLATGTRIDVLAATQDGSPGRPLAEGALVLAPPQTRGDGGDSSPPILLAVAPAEAAALAGAGPSAALSAVIVTRR